MRHMLVRAAQWVILVVVVVFVAGALLSYQHHQAANDPCGNDPACYVP